MLRIHLFIFIVCTCFCPGISFAENPRTEVWLLPLTITDDNSEIRYTYQGMGGERSGRSHGVQGKVWLSGADPRSVKAQITVPAPSLDSIAGDMLGSFGKLLQGTRLPPVTVLIDRIQNLCLPQEIQPGKDCHAIMQGRVQFGSLLREMQLPVRVQRKPDVFLVAGEGQLDAAAASQSVALNNLIDSASFSFKLSLPH